MTLKEDKRSSAKQSILYEENAYFKLEVQISQLGLSDCLYYIYIFKNFENLKKKIIIT